MPPSRFSLIWCPPGTATTAASPVTCTGSAPGSFKPSTKLRIRSSIDARVPGHGESVQRLRENRILIDGAPTEGQGLLLQIFTENAIGPIFFEIIQRKGNQGFGEGNFRALFESIEADQIKRGVLQA